MAHFSIPRELLLFPTSMQAARPFDRIGHFFMAAFLLSSRRTPWPSFFNQSFRGRFSPR